MLDSGILGVAFGLILVYFLLSLLASAINETIEAFWQRRARFLEVGIWNLLGDWTEEFYRHPLLEGLKPPKRTARRVDGVRARSAWTPTKQTVQQRDVRKSNPAYVPSRVFSEVVIALLDPGQVDATKLLTRIDAAAVDRVHVTVEDAGILGGVGSTVLIDDETFRIEDVQGDELDLLSTGTRALHEEQASVRRWPPAPLAGPGDLLQKARAVLNTQEVPETLRGPLRAFLNTAGEDLETWRTAIEGWFDEKMARVSGWYKRQTRFILFAIGLLLVVWLNADTVGFGRALWFDPTLRQSVVNQAATYATDPPETCKVESVKDGTACVRKLMDDVEGLKLPFGWPTGFGDWWAQADWADRALKVLGLIVTALALTLGSGFWFDLLNRVTNLRASGPPPKSALPADVRPEG